MFQCSNGVLIYTLLQKVIIRNHIVTAMELSSSLV